MQNTKVLLFPQQKSSVAIRKKVQESCEQKVLLSALTVSIRDTQQTKSYFYEYNDITTSLNVSEV